jgi:hypothetical protein
MTMNTTTAEAVRDELVAIGTPGSRLQRHQRRVRLAGLAVGVVVLGAATTGAAIVVNGFPGETTVSPLGTVITASGTGTTIVDLGAAPSDAGAVVVDITCTAAQGTISLSTIPQAGSGGSSSAQMDCALGNGSMHVTDGLLPADGSTSFTIIADPGTTWDATLQYASSSSTPWGVNANGQTYGVPNANGVPDLSPALATNGKVGYILNSDLFTIEYPDHGFINVYESDGTTVIGQFPVGDS